MKIKKPSLLMIALVLCLSSAASSFAADVKPDYDRAADFGRYKAFCWQKVETKSALWIQRIKAAVRSTLTAKGWTQAEPTAGFHVAIVAIEMNRDHQTVNTFYDGFDGGWGGWGWRGFGTDGFGESRRRRRPTGLVLSSWICSTPRPRNLIWRGSVTDTLSNKSDENIKKLNTAVPKPFEHFAPQPKN